MTEWCTWVQIIKVLSPESPDGTTDHVGELSGHCSHSSGNYRHSAPSQCPVKDPVSNHLLAYQPVSHESLVFYFHIIIQLTCMLVHCNLFNLLIYLFNCIYFFIFYVCLLFALSYMQLSAASYQTMFNTPFRMITQCFLKSQAADTEKLTVMQGDSMCKRNREV